jgi:hypothetical protein
MLIGDRDRLNPPGRLRGLDRWFHTLMPGKATETHAVPQGFLPDTLH